MGRKVEIRVSFSSDITYLSRLMRAIEKDAKRSIEWKRACIERLQGLIALFLDASTMTEGEGNE